MSIYEKHVKMGNERKRRSEPLPEDAAAEASQQVEPDLFDKSEDADGGILVCDLWRRGNQNRSDWLERQRNTLTQWDDFIDIRDTQDGPFEDASNTHLPVVMTAGKALHSRMYRALMGIEPPFTALPENAAAVDAIPLVDGVMRYALRDWANHFEGVAEVIDNWLWDWVFTGVGILKIRWDKEFTRYLKSEQRVEFEGTGNFIEVQNPETGEIEEIEEQAQVVKDVDVPITEKIFDGPVLERILPEDLLIIGGEGNPQKAETVIHRYFLTESDMWQHADQKIFNADIVKEIMKENQGDTETGNDEDTIKQDREVNSGVQELDTEADHEKYEILEAYLKLDINNDGLNEDVILWVHEGTRKILRATYLRRVMLNGRKPFIKIDFIKRQGQIYGMGVAEILDPLAREIDAMHNIRMDFGILSTMPFGFYRANSGMQKQVITLQPGKLIPVNDPQSDVHFPNIGNRAVFAEREELTIESWVERLISVSDINLGRVGAQGAARTATGVSALVNENDANLDIFIQRMQRGWREVLRVLFQLIQERMPRDMMIRITGTDGQQHPLALQKQDIQFKFDFGLEANSASSNRAIQRETADQILQLTLNPLLIQMGTVSPENIYQASLNWLQSRDIKGHSRFISKPQGFEGFMSAQEEINKVAQGIPVPIHPAANHEQFIQTAQAWLEQNTDPRNGSFFTEDAIIRVNEQVQQHQRMLEALQAQEAQRRNIQQQSINSQGAADGEVALSAGGIGDNQGG